MVPGPRSFGLGRLWPVLAPRQGCEAVGGLGSLGVGVDGALVGGTGLAQARIGSAAMGALAEKRDLLGPSLVLVAIPETMVILGFAVAAMIIFLLRE